MAINSDKCGPMAFAAVKPARVRSTDMLEVTKARTPATAYYRKRFQLLAFPDDEFELIRLGMAILLVYLRYLGRVLGPSERPHPAIIGIVAVQLGDTPAVWGLCGARRNAPGASARAPRQAGPIAIQPAALSRPIEFLVPIAMQTWLANSTVSTVKSVLPAKH